MASPDRVFLADRVKEFSYDLGDENISLDAPAKGFARFRDFYEPDDAVYYAITDGTEWEVGSGQYLFDGSTHALKRFAFRSSNNNNNVDLEAGVKEVFVTYPGAFAVFTAGPIAGADGIDEFQSPRSSGIAFWGSQQTLDYDPKLIWDTGTDRLGIGYAQPSYQIDVFGEDAAWSLIRSSGTIVGESGVMFSGVSPAYAAAYSGGIQLEPFMRNVLDTDSGADLILDLGGLVDQEIVLLKQEQGMVWAGPASSDCVSPPCPDDFPQFRYLVQDDIPDLRELYVRQHNDPDGEEGSIAFYRVSGEIQYDKFLHWDRVNNYLGISRDDPQWTLDVDGNTSLSGTLDVLNSVNIKQGDLSVSGNLTVSGNLDVQGNVTYVDSATMTILDPQIQLGSLSGTAAYTDAQIDNGGIVLQTVSSYDPKEWIWKNAINSWDTKEGVRASGDVVSSGFLTVARDVVFAENLTTSGDIGVSGHAQFDNTLNASGNVIFGNTLRVTSDFETSGTLNVSGDAIFDANVTAQHRMFTFNDAYFSSDVTVSGDFNVSGVTKFNGDVSISGTLGVSGISSFNDEVRVKERVIAETINISGGASLNYINGSTFFRQTSSDPFSIRINGDGINPYTQGSAYCGIFGREFDDVIGQRMNAAKFGGDTGQSFVYSVYGVDEDDEDAPQYQRLAISGARFGNFEISTEAAGSGVERGIDFKAPTNFTTDAPVLMSGTLAVSGTTTVHGGLETYSGGLPTHTVINASGFLTIPVYPTTAAVEAALPASAPHSGVIAFGGNSLMVCNGYSWFTEAFS